MIVLPPEILTQTGFSRASTAKYVDVDGVLKTAPADVPRPLYVGGALRGVMLEPAATNLLSYSEQFDNAAWIKVNCTITPNATPGPDGSTSADRLVEAAGVGNHFLQRNISLSAGSHTLSVWGKPSGSRTLHIQVENPAGTYKSAAINLTTGQVVTNSGVVVFVAPAANGFLRCAITFTAAAGAASVYLLAADLAGNQITTGDGSSGFYLYGADLKAGGVSSYILTAAAAATRAADVLALTGRDVLYSNAVEPSPAWVNGSNIVQGEVRVSPTTQRRYSALVAITGSAVAPESDPSRWKDIGAVNPLAMFDPGRNLQTVGPVGAKLRVAVYCAGRINSLFLTRLAAASGTVVMYVAGAEVYRKDLVLTGRKTRSWSTYCLGTFSQLNSVLLTDLPMLAGCTIVLELDNGAFAAKCASMVIGQRVQLGDSEWGGSSDPLVFSVVNRDDFGNAELVPRRMAPATSQTLKIPASQVPTAIALREQLNARFAVWAGLNDNTESPWSEMFLICGIYTRFKVTALSAKEAGVDLDLQEF